LGLNTSDRSKADPNPIQTRRKLDAAGAFHSTSGEPYARRLEKSLNFAPKKSRSQTLDRGEVFMKKIIKSLILLGMVLALGLGSGLTAFAQESDAKLIDEVIARVNAGVIMRSAYDGALREILEDLKKQNLKPEELEKQLTEWKSRVLDELISTQLLAQRAKDLSINVEPEVNQQMLRLMKENNCESQECLGQKMREAGFDIEDVKRSLTENFSKQRVLGTEVYGKVYRNLTEKEKREFYDKNKEAYTEPAQVTLSNIFIALGKDQAQSLGRAQEIAAQAKSGVDFVQLVDKYSESEPGKKAKGVLGTFKTAELAPEVKVAVESLAAGTVTEPIKLENGYSIFRVDARTEAKALSYDDPRVSEDVARRVIDQQSGKYIDDYLAKLRDDAFIEIDPRYQFENSKVKSAQIKHTPYAEDNEKKRKKEKKEKEREAKEAAKAAANTKP
jgi:parvulin-like peptidyl-prolyl isomerase